jgi:putative tryptophan/tyrosine transport system substrate-binding protein
MRRREFIAGLSCVAMPLAARAQQGAVPVIGFLNGASPEPYAARVRAFRDGLAEYGFVEGNNVAIEFRWAGGQYDRLPDLAADLVRRGVSVIAANTPAAMPAKTATTSIPIVFSTAVDPVASGLVASLNHPGGNLTGISLLNVDLLPKRVELLHSVVPGAGLIAAVLNPKNPAAETQARDLRTAVRTLGLAVDVVFASDARELDVLFGSLGERRAGAVLIGGDPVFTSQSNQLGRITLSLRLPAIHQTREFVLAGGLMSYIGGDQEDYRRVGAYVGRILKGEKPGDLPVQQTAKVKLIINLKTAKMLDITIPEALVATADEVIE